MVGVKVMVGALVVVVMVVLGTSVTREPVRSPVIKDCAFVFEPASLVYRDTSSSLATPLLTVVAEVVVEVLFTTIVCAAHALGALKHTRLVVATAIRIL